MVKFITIVFILFTYFQATAQLSIQRSVIASVGANESGSANLTTTWTGGEAIIGSGTDGIVSIVHGFQHPDESSLSVKYVDPNLELSVYPNPTRGEVFIELEASKAVTLTYKLVDLNGREIPLPNNTQHVAGKTQKRFDLTHLANATYMLTISGPSGNQLTSIHLIKH